MKEEIEYGATPLWKFLTKEFDIGVAFSLFAPYSGAGIKISDGPIPGKSITSMMELVASNTNYVGSHFGGSLYSMCDPFFMLLVIRTLGDDYIVWDKSATIDFLKPGHGKVSAVFHIEDETIEEIKAYLKIKRNNKFQKNSHL